MSAKPPPSRPSTIHISHSGLERSSCWEKIRPASSRSCSSEPGSRQRGVAHVVLEVEARVVDPQRATRAGGRHRELLAVARDEVQAPAQRVEHLGVGRRRALERSRARRRACATWAPPGAGRTRRSRSAGRDAPGTWLQAIAGRAARTPRRLPRSIGLLRGPLRECASAERVAGAQQDDARRHEPDEAESSTVKTHVASVLSKLGVRDRVAARWCSPTSPASWAGAARSAATDEARDGRRDPPCLRSGEQVDAVVGAADHEQAVGPRVSARAAVELAGLGCEVRVGVVLGADPERRDAQPSGVGEQVALCAEDALAREADDPVDLAWTAAGSRRSRPRARRSRRPRARRAARRGSAAAGLRPAPRPRGWRLRSRRRPNAPRRARPRGRRAASRTRCSRSGWRTRRPSIRRGRGPRRAGARRARARRRARRRAPRAGSRRTPPRRVASSRS